jgi:hypothetical protein
MKETEQMTWRELKEKLSRLDDDDLNKEAVVIVEKFWEEILEFRGPTTAGGLPKLILKEL